MNTTIGDITTDLFAAYIDHKHLVGSMASPTFHPWLKDLPYILMFPRIGLGCVTGTSFKGIKLKFFYIYIVFITNHHWIRLKEKSSTL